MGLRSTIASVRRLEQYVDEDDRRIMHRCALISLVATTILYLIPFICGKLLDWVIEQQKKGQIDIALLMDVCAVIFLMIVIWYTATTESKHRMAKISLKATKEMRIKMNSKMMKLPLSYIEGIPRGDMSARFTTDLPAVNKLLGSDYTGYIVHFTMIVAITIMSVITSPPLAFLYLSITFVIFLVAMYVTDESKEDYLKQKVRLAKLNTSMSEIIYSHSTIKTENVEDRVMEGFKETNREFTKTFIKTNLGISMISSNTRILVNIGYLVIVVAGSIMLMDELLDVGMFLTFMIYIRMLTNPIMATTTLYNSMHDEMISLDRIAEVLNAPEEEYVGDEHVDVCGRLTFEDVSFSYPGGESVLDSISLDIGPGGITALIGPTACGKTTLANLAMGFYHPDSGRVLIDGVDRFRIPQEDLGGKVVAVLQEPWVFTGSIRENIVYNMDVSEEDMLKVTRAIGLDRYVQTLPDGYDTMIGEEIGRLPLPQRRMISTSRAIIRRPKIMVLDESVAGMDPKSGQSIIDVIKDMSKDCTVLLITHNEALIDQADRILRMRDGRIIEG